MTAPARPEHVLGRRLLVLGDQRAGALDQLAAVDPLVLHLLDPGLGHRLGRLAPARGFVGAKLRDRVAAFPDQVLDHLGLIVPHLARHVGGELAGVLIHHLLQIGGERVVLRLVHREDEGRGIKRRRAGNLDVVLDQLVHLHGRHDLPRDHAAVERLLRQRLGQLRDRHRPADRAERIQRVAGKPRRRTQPQALHVVHGLDRLVGVHEPVVVRPEADRMDLGEFLLQVRLGELLHRPGVRHRALGGDEGKLEHLDGREAAWRRARQGPDDVGNAVARLIVQLRRRAAELHRLSNGGRTFQEYPRT